MQKTTSLFIGCMLTSMLVSTNSWADESNKNDRSHQLATYKITITNLTHGQPFAPVLSTSHRSGMSFFEVGQAPDDELAMLAEAGNGKPMAEKLLTMKGVSDAQVGTSGLTFPGKSSSMTITAKRNKDHVSIGAMLGATNDAFFAVTDVELPVGKNVVSYFAVAYDAGTETNDEYCSTVPGCGGGAAGYSPDDSGEGFVHVHNGIHGIGDLVAADRDWRSSVAKITIERTNEE